MGRKKIQISRIGDERNRQVANETWRETTTLKLYWILYYDDNLFFFAGNIYEKKIWFDEESLRIVSVMWLRNCTDYIQQFK